MNIIKKGKIGKQTNGCFQIKIIVFFVSNSIFDVLNGRKKVKTHEGFVSKTFLKYYLLRFLLF
jgi:hypothetical protein